MFKPKPKSRPQKVILVERGIYLRPVSDMYYERPIVGGKQTWRSLGTANLGDARAEYHRRRADQSRGKSPYSVGKLITAGEVIRLYIADGFKDQRRQARLAATMESEKRNCETLLQFWDEIEVESVTLRRMDEYCDWRCARITRKGDTGKRTVDLELNTLNNAMVWALRKEVIRFNPMAYKRPKYHSGKDVRHCREFMPADANELHRIARFFFEAKPVEVRKGQHGGKRRGAEYRKEVSGWQILMEAYTGLRTHEVLMLRADAKPGEPGYISTDGKNLHVYRGKGQKAVNPYVIIHPALKQLLDALTEWRTKRFPNSPWYFPSYQSKGKNPTHKDTVIHNMGDVSKKLGGKWTSHGLRAFYVTVRRSWGISDPQIAVEIGHTSGGTTMADVYGGVPLNWLAGDGPKMSWLPDGDPAWVALKY